MEATGRRGDRSPTRARRSARAIAETAKFCPMTRLCAVAEASIAVTTAGHNYNVYMRM